MKEFNEQTTNSKTAYIMPGCNLISYDGFSPKLANGVFAASGAQLIGNLTIGEESSIWFNTTIRADCNYIVIGKKTNIQDGTVIHVTNQVHATTIDDEVTIGHSVVLHGCHIGKRCLIGMGAIVMDGVEVGEECLVAAGSLLTPGKNFPPRHLIKGSPAIAVRPLTASEIEGLKASYEQYIDYKNKYIP